jgi:two-component system cell cycle sensor histidine kinase/response regulator CckA
MGTPLRVLIAEDSEEDTLLIIRELKRGGFDPIHERVETAEAMKAALSGKLWDLILADYSMPHFSGLDALKLLQKCGIDIPFIIVSGSIGEDTAVSAMKAGAHDYVMKHNLTRLVPAIQQELREAEVRRNLKVSQNALQQSEKRYRQVVENATEIIYTVDVKGNFTYSNPAGLKVTGYSLHELQKLNYVDLVLPDHRARVVRIYVKQFREKLPTTYVEFPFFGKSGQIIWFGQNSTVVMEGDRIIGFHIIARDITERKQAEEALRQSEERFRQLFDDAPVGYFEYDNQGHITNVNRTELEMLGYTSEEMVGQPAWKFIVEEEIDRQQILAKLAGTMPPARGLERTYRRKDGTNFPALVQDRLLQDAEGRILGIRATIQDITVRRQAEESLRSEKAWSEAIVSLAPNIVVGLDKESKILIFNKFAEKLTGFRAEEVMGKPWIETFIPEEMRGQLYGVWDEVVKNKLIEHHYEDTIVTKRGDERVISWNNTVLTQNGEFRMVLSIGDDTTERKQAEERLRLQGAALEAAANAIIITDREGVIEWANRAFTALTGYPFAEVIGRNPRELVKSGEQNQAFYKNLWDTILVGKVWRGQIINHRNDGSLYTEEMTITPLRNERGDVSRFIAIKQNITERKRAEEALRASEQKYRTLIENLPQKIFLKDKNSVYISCNENYANDLKIKSNEISGMSDYEFYQKELAEKYRTDDKRIIKAGKTEEIEEKYVQNGQEVWVNTIKTPVKDEKGNVVGILGIFWDITERKRAEEAVRRSEEEARKLAREKEVMAEIGRIISSTLNIEAVYKQVAEEVRKLIPFDRIAINVANFKENTITVSYVAGPVVSGREPGDAFPLPGSLAEHVIRVGQGFIIQDDKDELVRRYPMLLAMVNAGFQSFIIVPLTVKNEVIGVVHFQSARPNTYTETDFRLAQRVSNQMAGAVANAQLYAERIQAEKERASLEEQLRQSQKMEAIGSLAGGIAHDFNNLLTVIKGYSQLSSAEIKEGDPLKGNIEEIKKAADRAADLTRQLLAFSRRQIMEMRVLDLNTVLQNLDKMLHRMIGEDIELVNLLSGDLGRVKADPGQIEQVIINLAVNARDAMPKGGKLTIETANVELDEEYARAHIAIKPGHYVMLSVSDTGIGMTPKVKERIFEPFFTTKENGKGTGLGLSTVYGIVKQSGGNIWVYSEVEKGTTFKIYLPRVDEPLEELTEGVEKKELPEGSETIFFVEDNEEVRKLGRRILEKQGYHVLEASQGKEALQMCEGHKGPIQLMVTDVVMPGMDGRELANRLMSVHPETKVLYMSGYTDNAITHHGILEKGMHYIPKPFTVEGLLNKVREVLYK